jgi:mannose-6-phosphate isomerase-like protein (cupin superfamily)
MSDVDCLAGKLIVRTLPCLKPVAGVELPLLKRLTLPQGELAQFHDADLPMRYIAALELVAGTVRGNHYHTVKVEHVYVIRGALDVIAEEVLSGERLEVRIQPGDLVRIQPGVAHAFRAIESGEAVEFAPTRFDAADIHRHPLI